MGIKNFFRKIGQGIKKGGRWVWNGIKKAGRWAKDNVLPVVGQIAGTGLNILGALPGKIGMFGKLGSAAFNALHNITNSIPNEDVKQKVNDYLATGNEKFQGAIDKGIDITNRINGGINQARQTYEIIKNDPNISNMARVFNTVVTQQPKKLNYLSKLNTPQIGNLNPNEFRRITKKLKNAVAQQTLNQKLKTMPVDHASKIDVNKWRQNNM